LQPSSRSASRRKTLLLAALGGCGLILVLLLSAAPIAERLINLEPLRAQIATQLSQRLGAEVKLPALHLSFFPGPHLRLDDVSVSIPGGAHAQFASISIYPSLLSLLKWKIEVARVQVAAPDVTLPLPRPSGGGTGPPASVDETAAAALAAAAAQAPGLVAVVTDGRVTLKAGDGRRLRFTDVDAHVHLPPSRFSVDVTCGSDFWKTASAHVSLDVPAPEHAPQTSLEIEATGVDVPAVREAALSFAGEAEITRDIFAVLRGGTVSQLTVQAQGRSLSDLGGRDAMVIQGTLAHGRIHVPGVDLALDDVEGDASVAHGMLIGDRVTARHGNSRARSGTLRVGLTGDRPELRVETTVQADAAELPALLQRFIASETLARELRRIHDVQGTASGRLTLSGTTDDVATKVEVSDLHLSGRVQGTSDPLQIDGGRVRYEDRAFEASDLKVALGTSRLSHLSARVDWNATPASLDVRAGAARITSGEAYPWLLAAGWLPDTPSNPKAVSGTLTLNSLHVTGPAPVPAEWRIELAGAAENLEIDAPQLQQWIAPRYPLSLSDLRVARDPEGVSFSAKLAAPKGVSAVVELAVNPRELNIKRLSVRDAQSDASVSLRLGDRRLDLAFEGSLAKTTLDALLSDNRLLGESVKGNFRTHILLDEPMRSTAEGKLEANDIVLSETDTVRLRVERISLEAKSGLVIVDSTIDAGAHSGLHVHGSVRPLPEALVADLDLTAEQIDWERLEPFVSRGDGSSGADAPSWNLPVRGRLRVAAGAFTYAGFTWRPLRALVDVAPSQTTVMVTEANLCGIATPGRITRTAKDLELTFTPRAKGQQLGATLACLANEQQLVTGQYSLTAHVSARGSAADVSQSLQGHVEFNAKDGRIYRLGVLAKVLDVVSIATGSLLNASDVTKDGLAYKSIDVKGDVRNGTLVLSEAVMDGPSVKMVCEGSVDLTRRTVDLTFLAAPLKTVDSVVSRLPLIGTVLGGSLVSIPVRVTGELRNPKVTPLSASAVGKGLLGVMKRTIKLPFTVIEPLVR